MNEARSIILRKPKVEDAIDLAEEANDVEVFNGLRDYFPHPYSVDDALRFIDNVLEKTGPSTDFIIEIDGEVAGIMGVFVGEDVLRYNAELGYWLGKRFWGKGFMTDIIQQTIDHCWAHLPVDRLYAEVFSSNIGSQRVLQKCGFEHEYTIPNAVIKNGERLDLLCFGLRKP